MARGGRARFHAVLLAGGSGTRFWPLSRSARPKQFLALGGRHSLLRRTRDRVRGLAAPDRVWVVAPRALSAAVRRELPDIKNDRLVLEPSPRDTGPAVGLACAQVVRHDPEAIVGIFPTDHVIADRAAFLAAVRTGIEAAADGALVCLGVTPDRPATGYGYLRCASRPRAGKAVPVETFVEKPNLARARRFLADGRYLWNAGMFVWRAATLSRRAAPHSRRRCTAAVTRAADGHTASWNHAPRLSVDFAVMERARNVRVVPLRAGWDDVGSWEAAARLQAPDEKMTILVDSPETVCFGNRRTIAVVDVPGVVVVDTDDGLLIVSRSSSDKVKQVVDELKRRGRSELL